MCGITSSFSWEFNVVEERGTLEDIKLNLLILGANGHASCGLYNLF